jgi:hypothetical protein
MSRDRSKGGGRLANARSEVGGILAQWQVSDAWRRAAACEIDSWPSWREDAMPKSHVEVLLLSRSQSSVSGLLHFLDQRGCRCLVLSPAEALELADLSSFDLILSAAPLKQKDPLILRLSGERCTVFYEFAVEDGCWWVPLAGKRQKHLGGPAVPCREFGAMLEKVLREIQPEGAFVVEQPEEESVAGRVEAKARTRISDLARKEIAPHNFDGDDYDGCDGDCRDRDKRELEPPLC